MSDIDNNKNYIIDKMSDNDKMYDNDKNVNESFDKKSNVSLGENNNSSFDKNAFASLDKATVDLIVSLLEKMHPNASCELDYSTHFELLVAVILSAQCTDKRVNIVTKKLFKVCDNPQAMANISQMELENLIFECGFYHNKAKNLIEMSKSLIENFDSIVPCNMTDLLKLSGVGRKTANVIMAEAFGAEAIAVDTHVLRVSNRIGLAHSDNPLIVEKELQQILPVGVWTKMHHLLIFQGRYLCKSRSPECGTCSIKNFCNYYKNKERL